MKEYKCGEIFEENGKHYETIKYDVNRSKKEQCDICAFQSEDCAIRRCSPRFRLDGCYVYFKEIKKCPGVDTEQIKPSGNGVDIAELVKIDIDARSELGKSKYGERLQAHNGRDALLDAYQEALDLCQYLRQALEERK